MGTGRASGLQLGPSAALLVVDLQPDFMPGGALAVADGDAVVAPIAALVRRWRAGGESGVNGLQDDLQNDLQAGEENGPIIATQDWHPPRHISFASRHGKAPFSVIDLHGGQQTLWPDHCVQGTRGAALADELPQEALQLILRKGACADADSYSAFRENRGRDGQRRSTGLAALLKARGVERVFVCGLARDFCVAWTALDAAAEGFSVVVLDDLSRAVYPDRSAETDAEFIAAGVRYVSSASLFGP